MTATADAQRLKALKDITTAVYALQAAGFIIGITFIAAVILNYIKLPDVAGTLYESHFRWQIRTFWWGLLWSVIGGLTTWILIGFLILAATAIWVIYRIVKGWLNLSEGKPMEGMPVASSGAAG
ncbi:MAG TPA: hypothetical protein VD791_10340 [Burkholderiales bacterium]|jgi:uncharacterized membrane protein|nr:hypothetical protein [Burkholderiales bacterium]